MTGFCLGNSRVKYATSPFLCYTPTYVGASTYTVSVGRSPVCNARHPVLTAEVSTFRRGEYVTYNGGNVPVTRQASQKTMSEISSPPLPKLTPENFINRELANIDFQWRVMAMAEDERVPLLERLKFLAIVGNNLDEFFMVRVASIMQKMKFGVGKARPDGLTPTQTLNQIRVEVRELIQRQRQLVQHIAGLLEAEGIAIIPMQNLSDHQRAAVRAYFDEVIFPVLTPLAVDHARPFPFISNLSLNLGVFLQREVIDESEPPELEFARIKIPVPDVLPRLVSLNWILREYADEEIPGEKFLWIENVIQEKLEVLFPGMRVLESHPFRVLRNTDVDYEHEQEDDLSDIKSIIEQTVRERRFGNVVRVSVPKDISPAMLQRLVEGLNLQAREDVYMIEGALGSANLFALNADRPDLKFPPYVPRVPDALQTGDIFATIRRGDILMHHPYDSFIPVEEFFRQAAHDPDVLAIKATLYRVGKNSPVVNALMEARDNDKQVTVLVELKARFDEENNLEWAAAMERKGVHVIYGVEELPVKTHAKIALVVRREPDGVRRYVHLGTGNYNASTARLYTDMGMFTCNEEIADDASRLFNRLTGFAPDTTYQRLLVATEYLLPTFLDLIDNEITVAQSGGQGRLIFKMNQLEEDTMIRKLYQASQAGVRIDLIVRGLCCLRPGVPGLSENIRVTSIIGRYLEHSRVYYFANAPYDQQLYMGSADLMRRNLLNRVEVIFPVTEERPRQQALRMLMTNLMDNVGAWEMQTDGRTYVRMQPNDGEKAIDSQAIFMRDSFGLNVVP